MTQNMKQILSARHPVRENMAQAGWYNNDVRPTTQASIAAPAIVERLLCGGEAAVFFFPSVSCGQGVVRRQEKCFVTLITL